MCYLCIAFKPIPIKFAKKVADFHKICLECHVALPSIIPTSELQELSDVGEILSVKSV